VRVLRGDNGRRFLIVLIHKHGRDAAGFSLVLKKVLFEVARVVVSAVTISNVYQVHILKAKLR
jgi:hypothetical protein